MRVLAIILFLLYCLKKGYIFVKYTARCSTDVVLKENKDTGIFSTLDLLIDVL